MANDFKLLIDGQLVGGATALDVVNPATGRAFAACARADAVQLEAAVAAAKRAFADWSATALEHRRELLMSVATALAARAHEFARLLTAEQGKPMVHATGEILETVAIVRAYASMELRDTVLRNDERDLIVGQRAPLGVVAAITPWNYPMLLLLMKVAPALLAGNTVVAKPAPTTPLTTLLFGALCAPILPRGVFNTLVDANDLGGLLTAHPDIAKVAFTGSTATGRKVLASTAASIKRVALELGGNDAAIMLDDVDVQRVAAKIFAGAMANAGQVCFAIKRVYVPESLYEPVCTALSALADATVVGDGMDAGTQMGPVQNALQFERVLGYLDDAAAHGRIVAGGWPLQRPGYFVRPTIVRDIADDARVVQEEQFGPILPVLRYANLDDAIARVNGTIYGLGASLWAGDTTRAFRLARRIMSGTVWINKHLDFPTDVATSAAKQSGFGAKMGQAGLEEYTQLRVINCAKAAS